MFANLLTAFACRLLTLLIFCPSLNFQGYGSPRPGGPPAPSSGAPPPPAGGPTTRPGAPPPPTSPTNVSVTEGSHPPLPGKHEGPPASTWTPPLPGGKGGSKPPPNTIQPAAPSPETQVDLTVVKLNSHSAKI